MNNTFLIVAAVLLLLYLLFLYMSKKIYEQDQTDLQNDHRRGGTNVLRDHSI